VVGEWDGNGTWTIGTYRPSTLNFYLRNANTAGESDVTAAFGNDGELPVVGDWDGNGTVTIGMFDPKKALFRLRNANTAGDPTSALRSEGPGIPVAGQWAKKEAVR
jgi:hypothetical protein